MANRQVSDFTKQDKSLLFARLMEWETKTHEVVVGGWLFRPDASYRWVSNLYDPANMDLAWRVHLWALEHLPDNQPANIQYHIWFRVGDYGKPAPWTRKNAQRLLLDKIFELLLSTPERKAAAERLAASHDTIHLIEVEVAKLQENDG